MKEPGILYVLVSVVRVECRELQIMMNAKGVDRGFEMYP